MVIVWVTTNCPFEFKGVFVTVVHWIGGFRLSVCLSTNPVVVLVHERRIWLLPVATPASVGEDVTGTQPENSEVLFAGSVAVAVMT